jgi:hypothetical protein
VIEWIWTDVESDSGANWREAARNGGKKVLIQPILDPRGISNL